MPVDANSFSSKRVIRKPDRTKNTSTPTNPPWKAPSRRWNSTTSDDGQRSKSLDVGAELVVGDAVELLANGAPPGNVGWDAIAQMDPPELRVGRRRHRGRTKPTSRGRADLDRPPRHPPRLVAAANGPGGPRPTLHLGKIRVNRRSGEDSSQGPRRTFPRTWREPYGRGERHCRWLFGARAMST